MKIQRLALSELTEDPNNPRLHPDSNLTAIRSSLERFGQVEPLVVREGTNVVVGGNGRLGVMRTLGWAEADVVSVDLADGEAAALGIALNRTGDLAAWDMDALTALLDHFEMGDLGSFEMDDLLPVDPEIDGPTVDDEETPDVDDEEEPDSLLGAVYELGPHRLLCGDSTDAAAVGSLLAGRRADLVVTDPPYNIAGKSSVHAASVRPDSFGALKASDWDRDFDFRDTAQIVDQFAEDDSTVYVFTSGFLFGDVFELLGKSFHDVRWCVWAKPNPMPSLAKRRWTHAGELVVTATRGKQTFNFPEDGHALNVWTFPVEQRDRVHPTQKPVDVISHPIAHSSNRGDLVLDLFGGSGTTLIASAKLGRVAYLVERDPRFCDVIRKRWTKWAKANGQAVGAGAL